MRLRNSLWSRKITARTAQGIQELRTDQRGVTAIEFAMLAAPFFMMLFGIISVGLYFFVQFSLEHAVETAARVIRTGQAQTQAPNPMTVAQFKTLICAKLPQFMPCGASDKLRVNVTNYTGYGGITTPSCLNSSGNLIPSMSQSYSPGGASSVVLVSVCYEWQLAGSMGNMSYWISPKNAQMGNGSTLLQSVVTFTTEPYN